MCIQRRKEKWFRQILRWNCLLKYLIEGKVVGRRRRKKVPDDLKERDGYWKLKEEALDYIVWTARFGEGYGSLMRHTAVW